VQYSEEKLKGEVEGKEGSRTRRRDRRGRGGFASLHTSTSMISLRGAGMVLERGSRTGERAFIKNSTKKLLQNNFFLFTFYFDTNCIEEKVLYHLVQQSITFFREKFICFIVSNHKTILDSVFPVCWGCFFGTFVEVVTKSVRPTFDPFLLNDSELLGGKTSEKRNSKKNKKIEFV
jgi:hypothetical protein